MNAYYGSQVGTSSGRGAPRDSQVVIQRNPNGVYGVHTRDNVAHSRVNHHQLLLGNWNILTLTRKELEMVEEAKRYHLDIIGVSSTKRRGSGTVDLDYVCLSG